MINLWLAGSFCILDSFSQRLYVCPLYLFVYFQHCLLAVEWFFFQIARFFLFKNSHCTMTSNHFVQYSIYLFCYSEQSAPKQLYIILFKSPRAYQDQRSLSVVCLFLNTTLFFKPPQKKLFRKYSMLHTWFGSCPTHSTWLLAVFFHPVWVVIAFPIFRPSIALIIIPVIGTPASPTCKCRVSIR